MSGTTKAGRCRRFNSLAKLLVLGLVVLPLTRLRAEDPLPPLRRVYVTADQLQALGERYPELQSLSRNEFEDLVHRAQLSGQPSLPQVESARYQAALDGDRLSGTAELMVRGKRDARSMLRWPASAWAVSGARWDSGEASLGFAGRGELGLVVPPGNTHRLTFNWTVWTRATEAGNRFEFKVPPAMSAELALDLPRGLLPVAPDGVVSRPTDSPRPEQQRWLMRWSPADSVRCLLLTEGGSRSPAGLVVYGRDMEVDVAEEGTELLARMDLFVAHQPIQQLEFECSPGLKLFGWTGVKVHDVQERENRVIIDLAEPLQGSAQITVRGLAPGPADGNWKLPRLEIANGLWTGGQTRLRAAPGLHLYDPQVEAGRVVSAQDTTSTRPELIVEHSAPDAAFTARVSPELPQVFARIHSSVELGPRLEASVAASWQVVSGEVTSQQLRVPQDWSLEDVDVLPQGLLARWSVESDESKGRIATLRFGRAVSGETAISAQMRLLGPPLSESSSTMELEIPRLQPIGVHAAEEILSIELKQSWSAELVETKQLSSISRPSSSGSSVAEKSSVLSYRFNGPQSGGKLIVSRRVPELSAKIEVNADVSDGTTRVSYGLDLEIASGQPDSVDVVFHANTGDALTWDLPEGLRAERHDEESRSANGTESWRVTLPRKDVRRVRVNASWHAAEKELREIPLPTVLQATATTGQATVTFPIEQNLDAELKDLVPGPAPNDSAARLSPRRDKRQQSWRYGTGTPQLTIRVGPRPKLLEAESRVIQTKLRTTLDSHGGAIHTVNYEIHCKAGTEITLRLPSGATLRHARSNGMPLGGVEANVLRLTCPSGLEIWPLQIQFVTAERALGRWESLHFDLPEISIPSLRFSWEIDAPTDYAVLAWTRELIATPPRATKSWTDRLFGNLLRESDEGPFKFWQVEAWRNWWGAQTRPVSDPLVDDLQNSLEEFDREGLPRDRTWASLIAHLDQFTARRLVVDTIGLEASVVDLNSQAELRSDSSADSLMGLSDSLELNLLRTKRGLLLTSRKAAAEMAQSNDRTGLRVLNGRRGLAEAIDEATMHGADASGRFALASRWARLAEHAPTGTRSDAGEAIGALWRFASLADPATVSVTLVENSMTAQATTSIVCVAVLLAFVRKTRPGGRWLGAWILLVAVAFVLALALPEPLSAPAAALAWSQLAVLIIWLRRPHRERVVLSPRELPGQLPSTITHVGTAGALLLLSLVSWQTSSAEVQDKDTPKYSLVFIPYDPALLEKRHEASRVLVPRETYDRLVELARLAGETVEPVLIRSAAYVGRMAADRLELAIDLDIESLTSNSGNAVRASLPLSGLLIRSAKLDGKSCLLEPGPEGLTVEVRGSAVHKLHIEGVLALNAATGEGSFDLKIPPTPASKLDIELPPDITFDLEPATASTKWIKETHKQRLLAELGAVDHLIGRWRRGPALPAELHVDTASVFTWKQGASRLEVRASISVESGTCPKLAFELDPRLVLQRVRAAGMTGYWLRPGDRPQVALEFERPLEKQPLVSLEFLIPDSAGSKVLVPELRVAGAKPGLKLVAVRSESKATLQVIDPKEPAVATVEDFQGLWGEPLPRSPDLLILQLPANSPVLQIARTQTVERPVFRSQAELRVSTDRIDLLTQVNLESTSAKSFRHELLLPSGLELANIRASAGTQWRQVDPERLVWFGLPNGDAAPMIELQGWVPPILDSAPLPVVRPIGEIQLLGEMTVWHSRDLRVSVLDEHGLNPMPLKPDVRPPANSLVCESFHKILTPDFTANLRVERLTPQVSATVASRVLVEEDGTEWISVVDYQVVDGSFNKLEFRIPDTLMPPIQIAGEGIYRRDVRREGSDQLWTIQLEEPHWNSYRLVLRARIDPGHDKSLPVPTVDPLDVATVRKYLLLLNATEDKFDIRGAENQRSVPSEEFSKWFSGPMPKSLLGAFELQEPLGKIELQRAQPLQAVAARTTLLERHDCWWKPAGTILTESTLLIRSRTDGDALLELPDSTAVIDMRVDGHAVRPSSNPDGQLAFYLTPDDRPHEVHVWWSWDVPVSVGTAGSQRLELPRLTKDDCPAVWTVFIPPLWKIASSSTPATCRSLLEATQARAFAEDLEHFLELPGGSDSTERTAVLLDGELSFVLAADRLRRSLDVESEIGLNSQQPKRDHDRARLQLTRLLEQNRTILDRAGLASLPARAAAQLPSLNSPVGALLISSVQDASEATIARSPTARIELPHQGEPTYFATEGQGLALTLKSSVFKREAFIETVPAAMFGLFAWGMCLWLILSDRQGLALAMALAVIGAVWCWKLRVEPVGPALLLAAVLVALVGLIRKRTRARRSQGL